MRRGRSRVVLPVVPAGTPELPYEPPEVAPRPSGGSSEGGPKDRWEITRDEMAQTVTVFRETD